MIRITLFSTTAAAAALIAACSSGSGGSSAAGGYGTAPAATPAAATSGAVQISLWHGHLVAPGNRTLYTNTADTPTHLICTGSCLNIWPPVVGTAHLGAGLSAHDFGTVSRGSATQITFQGHPLYEFGSDKAGQAQGTGLTDQGGTWHPAGAAVTSASKSGSKSAPASSGHGGYGNGGGYGGGGSYP